MHLLAGPKNENGISTSYFKDPADGLNFWMGDAIVLQNQRLLVFLHKFDSKLAFHGAAIVQLDPKTLVIEKQIDVTGFPSMDIHWGTAMVLENDWLYIYGKGARNGKKQMFVARAKSNDSIDELATSVNWTVWVLPGSIVSVYRIKRMVTSSNNETGTALAHISDVGPHSACLRRLCCYPAGSAGWLNSKPSVKPETSPQTIYPAKHRRSYVPSDAHQANHCFRR